MCIRDSDQPMIPEGVKTEKSDSIVTQQYVEEHVEKMCIRDRHCNVVLLTSWDRISQKRSMYSLLTKTINWIMFGLLPGELT